MSTNTALAVSINKTAVALGIGRTKTYELINDGVLITIKIGRRRLVVVRSIEALLPKGEA